MRPIAVITNVAALLAAGATALPAPTEGNVNGVEPRAIPKECQKYRFWSVGPLWECIDKYGKTRGPA
ncbi:hypothetical protein VMCG_07729 [Cytospora schulzeri]|uniref:Uncharacterized protein n=1 Tax=Cytospora schulzeri TaxID=448051 RepID=A0A423VZ15_9PEZI|nr:hypothetical protein VMCG_07729 [Valsa malicola]